MIQLRPFLGQRRTVHAILLSYRHAYQFKEQFLHLFSLCFVKSCAKVRNIFPISKYFRTFAFAKSKKYLWQTIEY